MCKPGAEVITSYVVIVSPPARLFTFYRKQNIFFLSMFVVGTIEEGGRPAFVTYVLPGLVLFFLSLGSVSVGFVERGYRLNYAYASLGLQQVHLTA